MSKRINRDNSPDINLVRNKRYKVDEGLTENSMEDNSESSSNKEDTKDEACDKLFNIFSKIICDLHKCHKRNMFKINAKSKSAAEEQKVAKTKYKENNDVSVRLKDDSNSPKSEVNLLSAKDHSSSRMNQAETYTKNLKDEILEFSMQEINNLNLIDVPEDPRAFLKETEKDTNGQIHHLI